MKVIGMMLVRNEADRWLKQCLRNLKLVCDEIIVLDDGSTDDTAEICTGYGCKVYDSGQSYWGTNELKQRKRLFDLAIKEANVDDWLFCLDADEILVKEHIPYLNYLFRTLSTQIDGITFRLYDMWNDKQYREDECWKAHLRYWCMAIRLKDNYEYEWIDRKLHCGRFPKNASPNALPTMLPIKHMGWSTEKDRLQKYKRYMLIDKESQYGIIEQYKSILDKNPNLKYFYEG